MLPELKQCAILSMRTRPCLQIVITRRCHGIGTRAVLAGVNYRIAYAGTAGAASDIAETTISAVSQMARDEEDRVADGLRVICAL